MRNHLKTKLISSALAIVLGGTAAQASAEVFYFDQRGSLDHDGTFMFEPTADPAPGNFISTPSGAVGAGYVAGTHSTVGWARDTQPGNMSSLTIETFSSLGGHLATGGASAGRAENDDGGMNLGLWDVGEWWTISKLTQDNMVIPTGGDPLWSMDAVANFEIFSDAGHGNTVLSDLNSVTSLTFSETQVGPDFYETPAGDFAPLTFGHMGMNYQVNFRILPLMNANVTLGNPIIITTMETDQSMVAVQAQIEKIPEPGSLAIMSLGLVLVGGMAARRKK